MTTTAKPRRRGRRDGVSTIRAFFFWPFIRELGNSGLATEPLLKEHGLTELGRLTPYTALPLSKFVAFIESMARTLRRPYLGLEIGEKFQLADLGPFYAMFTLASDLRAALTTLANYQWLWQTHTTFSIARGRNVSTVSYLITDHEVWPRRHDAECALASFCALIRQLTHSRWMPEHVQFEHSVAGRTAKLRRYFRCAVTGGSSANILTIRNEDLDRRMQRGPGAPDISILPNLELHLKDLVTKEPLKIQSAADLVNAYIARGLGRETTSIVDAAAHIGLSVRTLRRRLAEEGLTYRKILRTQRQQRSEAALRDGDTPLTMVAQQLGYSDYTTLSRAFKGWTGISPQRFALTKSR